jgi:hypothetical protein
MSMKSGDRYYSFSAEFDSETPEEVISKLLYITKKIQEGFVGGPSWILDLKEDEHETT